MYIIRKIPYILVFSKISQITFTIFICLVITQLLYSYIITEVAAINHQYNSFNILFTLMIKLYIY